MRTRWSLRPGVSMSWVAAVSVVTVLATLAITLMPESRQTHAGVNRPQGANSVLAPLGTPTQKSVLAVNYGKLPLSFEMNQGQSGRGADFISRGRGYTMFLAGNEAVLSLRKPSAVSRQRSTNAKLSARTPNSEFRTPETLRMKLVGANAQAAVSGIEKLPGVTNYYIGNDPKKWRTGVPNYAKVHYDDVYPGVDLVYYGNQRQLEFDFVVAPGADPRAIALDFVGADGVRSGKGERRSPLQIDNKGDLVIATNAGEVRFHRPVVYQEHSAGNRAAIEGRFTLLAENHVGFEVGAYDKTRPLVIDPSLNYATYLGGDNFDGSTGIAADSAGNAYVVGTTFSTNYPVTDGSVVNNGDATVTKLNSSGTAALFSTYLGGSGSEDGMAIAIDAGQNVYLGGDTFSADFPGAAGGDITNGDGFVTKLDNTGALVFSKLFGGSGFDVVQGVKADSNGNIYLIGNTTTAGLTIVNGFQATCGSCGGGLYDAFVAKLTFDGTAVLYSSFLGGTDGEQGRAIAIDGAGKMFVIGTTFSTDFPLMNSSSSFGGFSDAYVAEIDPAQIGAASLLFSTYIGDVGQDVGNGIAIDNSGKLYIAGFTDVATTANIGAPGFQTTNAGLLDAFVAKVDPSNATYVYATLLGGSGDDDAASIAVDANGNAFVTGTTYSSDFPTASPVDNTFNTSTLGDTYVAEIAPDGMSLVFSTYLGGEGQDIGQAIAVNTTGQIFVAGNTNSPDFPSSAGVIQPACGDAGGCDPNGFSGDGFVASYGAASVSGPVATATPSSLAFGNVATATTSTKVVQIKNTGTTTLTLSSIIFSNNNADVFETDGATTTCTNSSAIPANDSCDIGINFTPAAELDYTASLDIGSNDPNTPTHIALTGTGSPAIPAITVNPTGLNFGNVTVDASSTKTVTVTNSGTAPLTITVAGITITQSGTDYAIAAAQTTCVPGTPIAVDASCNVGVTLTPGSEATFNGTLNILSDAPTSPTAVSLTGVGVVSAAAIDVSPASLDFGSAQVGSVINYPVTVKNTGTDDLILSGIAVGGANPGNFTSPAAGTTCAVGAPIAPDASCVITVDFHSTAVATFNATLTITSNASNSPSASGPLTGKGSDFNFGVQEGGSTSDTVTAGQTAVFNLSIGGTPGAAGTATLGCTENIPNAACGVSPATVVMNDTTPSNFIVSVATTAPTAAMSTPLTAPNSSPGAPMSLPASWMWVAALAMMLATMAAAKRRARVVLMAAMLFVVLWSSCVGNSPRATTSPATPAGVYPVTVTATVNGITKSQIVTVTVN